MNTFYRLQNIFREVFDDATLQLSPELSVANCPAWDSVAMVQLMLATEAEFGLRFTTDEMVQVRSVTNLLALIDASIDAPRSALSR